MYKILFASEMQKWFWTDSPAMSFALLGGTFEGTGIAARGYLNVKGKKDIVLFLKSRKML